MKNEIVPNSCRVCLTKTKKMRSLYKPVDEEDEPPNKMLHLVTGIKVEKFNEHETLPKNICKNCELSLSMAFEFRENALKTQQIIVAHLKQVYQNDNVENKTSITIFKNELEELMDIERLECVGVIEDEFDNLSNDQRNYSLNNDEELSEGVNVEDNCEGKIDQLEVESYNNQEVSCFLTDGKENKDGNENSNENYIDQEHENEGFERDSEVDLRMSDDDDAVEYTEEQVEIMVTGEESFIINPTNFIKKSTKTKKKKIAKISTKSEKTKGKRDINLTENVKLIPRRGRKPSSNINQNGHICDICGNVFSKRGRMMEHRQRHDKECRFCCEICEQKFFTRELLRKHMFSHSGGKPLKCEFCSRTFYYESVRKAHESVHKGVRPYVCDVCGKSFSYAHALKKHKLIHAEIKLYRCEYCNKDFRLQHHMKQHELTKLHQNTVRFAKSNISFETSEETIKGKGLNEDIIILEDIADDELAEGS